MSAKNQNKTGFELDFTYSGPYVPAPTIADCPAGLQRTKVWTIANAGSDRFIITSLAGYQGKPTPWAENPAKANTYLGSSSYQLAVSTINLNPGEVGSVGLCASTFGAKEKDGSLYLAYHLLPPGTQTPGPTETIGWAGTGTVGTSKYTPDRFTVDEKTNTITIKGQPYNSSGTGTASTPYGLPYINWKESSDTSTIIGNDIKYRLIRYGFSNVPLGSYEVTGGPKGVQLLPNQKVNVVLRDRNFNQITFVSKRKDVVMANSRTLGAWETFTFEYAGLSADKNALGYLRGANGQYVVRQGDTLIVQADEGQPIEFVGWNSTANDSKFITNWGRLAFDGSYVTIDPLTFDLTFTKDSDKGTNFANTFIDKGKKALTKGSTYTVSLTYGIADDSSQVTCSHLGADPPAPCYQYYLYANLGYPYGYFSYSPVTVAGGFGKTLGIPVEQGGSPFSLWKFEAKNSQPTPPTCDKINAAVPSSRSIEARAGKDAGIDVKIKFDDNLFSVCFKGKAEGYATTTLQLLDSACEYHFTLAMEGTEASVANFVQEWDQMDHSDLKAANAFLHFDRIEDEGTEKLVGNVTNDWNAKSHKPYTMDITYSAGTSDKWDSDNTAYIRYGGFIDFNAPIKVFSVRRSSMFSVTMVPDTLEFNLRGITCSSDQKGSSS
ncbi:hypothetical protein ACTRXD_07535 [Nitrospira sp. T9]|uniref:hypothetical protein n=1 Tax=unclassified Nitrospira TaxID=2652172 RepID=UPI003F9743CF